MRIATKRVNRLKYGLFTLFFDSWLLLLSKTEFTVLVLTEIGRLHFDTTASCHEKSVGWANLIAARCQSHLILES